MPIKKDYIIEKSNILIEIKNTNMTLQELRFFCIYLSKINSRDVDTRCVTFPMSEFQKIMGFGKLNIKQIQQSTNKLLCKVVNVPSSDGGYTGFTLFKRVRVFKDDFENWNLEINASDDALPLFFNLKGNYLTYELWNILSLKSVNQVRMYELLKRYEKLGIYEIKMSDLREYFCIEPTQYPRMERFKARILDDCQKALTENTDICFTYECGKRGSRGKWLTIVFHISKNDKHSDPMELNEFMDKQSASQSDCPFNEQPQQPEPHQSNSSSSALSSQPYLSGEFEKDLSPADIKVLCDMLACKVPVSSERTPELLKKRLKLLYSHMLVSSKDPIKSACAYLKGVIINIDPDKLPSISSKNDDFDVAKYERICINNFYTSI